MKQKTVIVLRSVSGAGKSTLAELLCQNPTWVTVCADDYFMVDGEYMFDPKKIGRAHNDCQNRLVDYLTDNAVSGIVVANTNTKESDFSFYEKAAKEYGANFVSLVVENRHGNENIHNVPSETLDRQEQSIRQSLKLR